MGEQRVPRIVIVVEAGVVKRVMSNTDVEFVVLDDDLLNNEDIVGIAQLVKTFPSYALADLVGESALDNRRKCFKEEAQRRLRLLTE
jgi:hypothetical protein